MFVSSDFFDLLRIFNDNSVRYLVIGGYALIQYAEPRYTKDLDLWIRADEANAKAVFRALSAFGAPLKGLSESDFSEERYKVKKRPFQSLRLLVSIQSMWDNPGYEALGIRHCRGRSE